MKSYIRVGSWGAITALLLVGALTYAQQEKIEDQDLLSMIKGVKGDDSTAKAPTPISETKEVLEVVAERNDDAVVPPADTAVLPADTVVPPADIAVLPADTVVPSADTAIPPADIDAEVVVDNLEIDVADDNMASSLGNLISVRLNKVDLEEAISLFAQLSGANIIVPELVESEQISVNLKDVEWRPALQSILDTYNYELYQKVSGSNVFSVRRRPPGAPDPQVVETFILKYATVPNAAELVRDLLPPEAKVSEFASRNMLVVKSSESSLSEVRAVLETIDQVRQQVFIESKFMELSDDAQKDLGIDWSSLQSFSAGTVGSTTKRSNDSDSSTKTTSSFTDINGLQYEEAGGYQNYGQRIAGSGLFTMGGVTPTASEVATKATTDVLTSVLSADEFRLVLSALAQNKGVNVVSNPKVIVANEELANISIIRKEPNLKQEREQQLTDQPATTTFTLDEKMPFFEYGIKLDVLPSINTSSNITIQINPSLTRKFADKQAGEVTYPVIDEKSIKTVFNLASGQTAAIGGLTEVTEGDEEKKIPVLGSIPFLGRLFSWKQTIRGQSETIIFVTVGLANTQDIKIGTGMPGDAELARRQIIRDNNNRVLRDSGRKYYEAEESDKLEDMIKLIKQKEDARVELRVRAWQKEQEKAAKDAEKELEKTKEAALID